jgi:acyl-CoA synthetase (AMP-forming)/AMP-acid ligase II
MPPIRPLRAVSEGQLADDPPWTSVGALVADAARRFGDAELLRLPEASLSFAEVDQETRSLAAALQGRGVERGDRVALFLPNEPAFPATWLAILRLGAVAVPIAAASRESDLVHMLAESQARMLVTTPDRIPAASRAQSEAPTLREVLAFDELSATALGGVEAVDTLPDRPADLASLQFTSGTTGVPKACMLTHDYWLRLGWQASGYAELRAGDVVLTAQAYSYLDPQWMTVMCLVAGVPLVVLPRFSASRFWSSVREHEASFLYLIGSMPLLLLKQPAHPADRDHRVRLVLCSGIVPELHAELEQRWGVPWREAYGMTETGVDLVVTAADTGSVGTGAVGGPTPTKEVRVVDADGSELAPGAHGELQVRGRPMMLGYWNRPEETAAVLRDGWLSTGDLAHSDAQGYYYLAGRLKDMVRRGGENISSAEVEGVLGRHPLVLDAAVVPVPDPLWGEEVMAFVQLRPGAAPSRALAGELREHVLERLARFKAPRYVGFVNRLPRTPSERIAKHLLRSDDSRSYDLDGPS